MERAKRQHFVKTCRVHENCQQSLLTEASAEYILSVARVYPASNTLTTTPTDIYASTSKGVDLTGLLGDIKEDWGDFVPQKLKLFCETTHNRPNICIKIQQTIVVAVTG